jgi:hypothetical protein
VRLATVALVAGAGLAQLGAKPASKVTVLSRTRVGGYAEELTYVAKGPLANQIAFVEGYEVWGTPAQAAGQPRARKLFDLYALDPVPRPTGIAYVESRGLFVVNDSGPSNFFFVDHQGRPKGSASMTFPLPDGYTPNYIEGLAYIPPTAGTFPDHLVMAAQNSDGTGDLLVVDLAGSVVKHIVPNCFDSSGPLDPSVAAVEYLPGDRLVLVDYSYQALCVVDFDGVASTPVTYLQPYGGFGEGVTRLPDGRIVALEYPQNLTFFDADLSRLPQFDRHDVVGLGLNSARGLAWDSATSRHLISYPRPLGGQPSAIAAVPPNLAQSSQVVDLTSWPGFLPILPVTRAMTYLGAEGRFALAQSGRAGAAPPVAWIGPRLSWFRGLLLGDATTGALVEQVDLCVPSAPTLPSTCTRNYGSLQPPDQWGRAAAVAYIPGGTPAEGRFAVRFALGVTSPHPGIADAWTVYLFDRSGAPAGAIDLGATAGITNVVGLESFDPGDGAGGRLAVLGRVAGSTDTQLVITDLAGLKLDSLGVGTELGLPTPIEVSVITTGPHRGAFAVFDGTAQDLVVFRVK